MSKTIEYFNKNIDSLKCNYSEKDIDYQKKFIDWLIHYIHKQKQNGVNLEKIQEEIYNIPQDFILSIASPSINDYFCDRTRDLICKNKKLLETHVESFLKKDRTINNTSKKYYYDENMDENIQKIIAETISAIFSDTTCINKELINLRENYLNGNSDKLFISTLTNNIQKYNNSIANLYFYKFIQKIKKNPELVTNTLLKKHNELFEVYDDLQESEPNLDSSINEKIILKQIKLKHSNNDTFYSEDLNKNIKILIQQILLPSFNSDLYEKILNQTPTTKMYFNNLLGMLLNKINTYNCKNYKYALCNRIKNIVEFLDKLELLDEYNEKNNKRLDKLNLHELQFTKEELLNSLTNINNSYNFSLETLHGLSSFYSNRASKSASELCKSIFLLKKLDLFEKIYITDSFSQDNIDISDDEFKEILAQYDLIINDIKHNVIKKFSTTYYTDKISETDIHAAYDDVYELNKTAYENRYPGCYDEDYHFITKTQDSFQDCLYLIKTQTTKSLVYTALKDNKKNIINWGYIKENNSDFDDSKILLGFDIQSLNMPIKLHVKKEDILPLIQSVNNNSIIPCYLGENDMYTSAGNMSTQVLNVIPKDKKKEILKNTRTHSLFFSHIKWLQRPMEKPDFIKPQGKSYDINTGKIIKTNNEKDK